MDRRSLSAFCLGLFSFYSEVHAAQTEMHAVQTEMQVTPTKKLVALPEAKSLLNKKLPIMPCTALDDRDEKGFCFSSRMAFDMMYASYHQYGEYSAVDYSYPLPRDHGRRLSGYVTLAMNAMFSHGQVHVGFMYLPGNDRGHDPDNEDDKAQYQKRMVATVEEAYMEFMPIDHLPLMLRIGKSYTPYGAAAITYPDRDEDHPVIATNTFLMTQTRANIISLAYDDYEDSGFSASAYLQSHHSTVDEDTGSMEAWGLQASYQTPTAKVYDAAFGLNLSMVSNPEAVVYLSDLLLPATNRAYSGLAFINLKRLRVEYGNTFFKIDRARSFRAWDYAMTYRLGYQPVYGESNLFFGWGKSYHGQLFEVPETTWWIGVKQAVDRNINLSLVMFRGRSYADSAGAGDAERKVVFRLVYAL